MAFTSKPKTGPFILDPLKADLFFSSTKYTSEDSNHLFDEFIEMMEKEAAKENQHA